MGGQEALMGGYSVTGEQVLQAVCLLTVIVGVIGVVVPALPGLLLCWASVLGWALLSDAGWGKWLVLGLCTLWVGLGIVVKYAWPGKRLKEAGVPTGTLLAGVGAGLVGMFVIPVVGLLVGFVTGVWAAEWARHSDLRAAWPSTKEALLGAGLSILIELTAAMLVLGTLIVGMVAA
jgi:uncharacterized protein YqgC (DUF456 family)